MERIIDSIVIHLKGGIWGESGENFYIFLMWGMIAIALVASICVIWHFNRDDDPVGIVNGYIREAFKLIIGLGFFVAASTLWFLGLPIWVDFVGTLICLAVAYRFGFPMGLLSNLQTRQPDGEDSDR